MTCYFAWHWSQSIHIHPKEKKMSSDKTTMIFQYLKPGLNVEKLPQIVPGVKINYFKKKDYDPSVWRMVKNRCGSHFHERLLQYDIFYRVVERLYRTFASQF